MNYTGDDYSMGHILRFARESGTDTLTMDLLRGEGHPATLLKEPYFRRTGVVLENVSQVGAERRVRPGSYPLRNA